MFNSMIQFVILSGFIGKITLQIPLRRLRSDPWVISIKKLYLVAGPLKHSQVNIPARFHLHFSGRSSVFGRRSMEALLNRMHLPGLEIHACKLAKCELKFSFAS